MKEFLNVSLIQTSLIWESPEANRIHFNKFIASIKAPTDIIVLPEMFTTGFTMNPARVAETMDGATVSWMQQKAKETNAALVGSLVIKEKDNFFNRLLFVHPSGKINSYDKRHTFTLAGEHKVYKAGTNRLVVDYLGWKICPLICYDLRFPVWSRNIDNYDVLLYVANWPTPRIHAWKTLLQARAIENMSYTIGVNRIGTDENNNTYNGCSMAVDVLGNILATSENEEILHVTLEKETVKTQREKLPFLNDRDVFNLTT